MANITVETVIKSITVTMEIAEARALLEFLSSIELGPAPPIVREISRRFRSAVERGEAFVTKVT